MTWPEERVRWRWLVALLCLAALAAGCAPGAVAPPRADVAGIQVVAIFPFANDTNQAGLENELLQRVTEALQASGWYEVVPVAEVQERLSQRRPSPFVEPGDEQWLELARDVTLELGADGFIAGRIIGYEEETVVGEPYAETPGAEEAAAGAPTQWRVAHTTRVIVTVAARLVNAHTGEVVHERTVRGVGRVDDVRLLNWTSPAPPPAALLPATHRRDIPRARELAVEQALMGFAADLLPQRATDAPGGESGAGGPAGE